MNKTSKNESGMTLLELMFACGIAATALTLVFGSLITISVVGRINESKSAATVALASVMEEIRSLSYSEVLAYIPPEVEGPGIERVVEAAIVLPGEESESDGGDVPYGEEGGEEEEGTGTRVPLPLAEDYQTELPNPIEVEVTLTWQEDSGHTFQVKASTVKGK